MNFNFSPETKYESPNTLVPAGTLAFALLKIRGIKNSNNTSGEYADVELVLKGQYENRRVFTMIANPADARNGDTWRGMGQSAIQHIMEAAGVFTDEASYGQFANASFRDVLMVMDGKTVAIKIKIEKGKDGHQDKNAVSDWLSPNPNSSTNKAYATLKEGGGAKPEAGGFMQAVAGFATAPDDTIYTAPPAGVATNTAPDWL